MQRNGKGQTRGRQQQQQRPNTSYHTSRRFPDRGGPGWVGPLVDYKEVELLRKFLTSSSKLMSRKRAGTNSQEQRALKIAVKRARFLSLIPYTST
ncbi:MAG: 30S ribosomal protein S18 [Phycisphaerales bacterium]|nr:MAG: 30S ribosomal protein S18 [Phycisphaerales bacterium]